MLQRAFGDTGLRVSALGFGAGHIGGADMDDGRAGALLNSALDAGITFIDTARGYGLSEERIGRHIAHRRGEYVLCSKCGYGVDGVPDWTPECIRRGIDEALGRLRTDAIDVMIFHSCPRDVLERPGLVEALLSAVEAGKVRFAGYSGENDDLGAALGRAGLRVFETSVNLFDQASLRRHIPAASARGAAFIAKRPIANAPWRFAQRPAGHYGEVYWERMAALGLAPPEGMSWDELALRFAAFAPGVGTAIAGTASIDHLRANAAHVAKGPLPREVADRWIRAFDEHGSQWHGQI